MRLSHIGWNLGGLSLPLLVAAVTVPQLIDRLGNERFGLLALAWGLIGYAGALDLGIGRALTQMVAKLRGEGDVSTVPEALATASRLTMVSGVVGGSLIALFALIGDTIWVTTQDTPDTEIRLAMLLMAVALPAQAMSATYRGLNEAYQRFKGINLLRIALGAITFGGPYLASFFTQNVAALVATLAISRLGALVTYRYLARSCLVGLHASPAGYSTRLAKRLLSFGGWVTISSVASPLLVQADRFVIGAAVSASAVTIYVLPYEVVTQSLILVGAISSVAFPALTTMMSAESSLWRPYFLRWLGRVAALMLIVTSLLAISLPRLLSLWLGETLDPASTRIGQILCIGALLNAIATMYYALIHAKGAAHITAKFHLIELPFFLVSLLSLVTAYGPLGAAWAWTARTAADLLLLAAYSHFYILNSPKTANTQQTPSRER